MKTIVGLDEKPESIFEIPAEVQEQVRGAMPSYREMMIAAVGGSRAASELQAMEIHAIVRKLRVKNKDQSVQLEDAELSLLTEKIRENAAGEKAFYQAQVFFKLKEAK